MSDADVAMGKNFFKQDLLQSMESSATVCDDLGKQILRYGRRHAIPDILHRIDVRNFFEMICFFQLFTHLWGYLKSNFIMSGRGGGERESGGCLGPKAKGLKCMNSFFL